MTPPSVSVCVVSWHRPEALRRCLVGLGQLQYPDFEIVAVADAGGLAALPEGLPIKRAEAREANISAARNEAIRLSAGEIVAFIDDDAVPEPTWLSYLTAPFAEPGLAAVGGYVRARNGISWQWRGRVVNALGQTRDYTPGTPVPEGYAVKTEGTNMAVRRDVLRGLGGFDPAFRFFLDETDLNIRLQAAGHRTALVPEAEVHHGFFASDRRRADRVPTDLRQIGASWSVFLRKHAPGAAMAGRLQEIRREENARLVRHLIGGGLEPRDLRRLRRSLEDGIVEGGDRAIGVGMDFDEAPPFLRYPAQTRPHRWFSCTPRGFAAMREVARDRVAAGENVTVFSLSRTALYHRVSYGIDGVWVHSGGVYGKSDRNQKMFRFWRREDRIEAELERVGHARNVA